MKTAPTIADFNAAFATSLPAPFWWVALAALAILWGAVWLDIRKQRKRGRRG